MSISYIDELNESQREAVTYSDGPALVIAGAGSGKTRVLTYKIAYLLENGYEPWNILALTFTNKAAREMKERVGRQVGEKRARYLWMGTFHSIFGRILRAEAGKIGFTSQYTIYDAADSKSLVRDIITKTLELDEKVYRPGVVQARISNAKNHLVTPEAYAANRELYESDAARKMPLTGTIYKLYRERCRQANAMDFDDLLVYTYLLFRDNPDVLGRYREQFRYILVDEYQDTNVAQHSIVLQLAGERQRVCVVGDDAQSIYSFRGANIDNILRFTETFPNARLFKLERNYRSTQTIVRAANSLIAKNQNRIEKDIFSEKERGEPIGVFQAYSDIEEADIVVNKIGEMRRRSDYGYADFAILYRTNAQSRVFEEALRKRGMPYRVYGGLSFYQRKEIKDVVAYFRLVVNPDDEEALKRVVNYPARGIGATTVGKVVDAATTAGVSLWTVIGEPQAYGLEVSKATQAKLRAFREMIERFAADQREKNAYTLGLAIIRESGIWADVCKDDSPENLSRRENIEELANGMSDFRALRLEEGDENVALTDYLSEIALLTDQDSDKADDGERVTMMTVHSAKGLEFRNVFVVGLEEGLFPSERDADSAFGIEEERRLFYVAITRAEEHCFLSYARARMRYGRTEFGTPSRFLNDIDTDFLRLPDQVRAARKVDEEARRFRRDLDGGFSRPNFKRVETAAPGARHVADNATPPVTPAAERPVAALRVGQWIEHERFGLGEVVKVEGSGENAKATINFENSGEKHLLLRFAKFEVVK
ncbi:MAG: UvrD-helicase domain-containing protein [Mediterranea sp.]|jgi:DNA helicase-2/ATP-dependent DNA helicase PcrA|nr:UvrD-helicase domain-containing protein [Mediterranea sp.]